MSNELNNQALVESLAAVGSVSYLSNLITDKDSARKLVGVLTDVTLKISRQHNFKSSSEKAGERKILLTYTPETATNNP